MASVSGSDSSSSSSANDQVRRDREAYNQNESEMIKKHQREIKRLNEQHAVEIESLKKEHEHQINEMQKKSSESLSEKDQRYQSEIDGLRNMHRKQLQSSADEQQRKDEALRSATNSEKTEQKTQSDMRFQQLNDSYKKENDEKEARMTDSLQRNREEELRGLDDQRTKLVKAHENEMEDLRQSSNRRLGDLQKEYGGYRRETVSQREKADLKHLEDSQRQGDNLVRAVAKERADRTEAEKRWRDDSGEGLVGVKETYQKSLDQNRGALEKARGDMEENYHGHVAHEMRTLTDQNERLKNGNDRFQRNQDAVKAREMANYRDAYQRNIDNYKMQRDETVRASNERRAKDINDLTEKNDKLMTETNRYYLGQKEDQDRRLKSEYRNINSDFQARTDQLETQTDARVKNVISSSEDEKQRIYKNSLDAHDKLQRQQADTLKTVRLNTDDEKAQAVERVKVQARQQEINHADKMTVVTQKHQRDMAAMQDQLLRERRDSDENLRKTVADMERAQKTSLDQQQAKYEERIRNIQNQQAEELRRVSRANDERMSQMAASKKA